MPSKQRSYFPVKGKNFDATPQPRLNIVTQPLSRFRNEKCWKTRCLKTYWHIFFRVDQREKMISPSLPLEIVCPLKQEFAVPNVKFATSDTYYFFLLFLSSAVLLSCLCTYNQKVMISHLYDYEFHDNFPYGDSCRSFLLAVVSRR